MLVASMRTQAAATECTGVAGLSAILRATVEQYPDLKTSGPFPNLQKSLIETEQRIALARDYVNNIATFYNGRLQIFPDKLIASVSRFQSQVLMGAEDIERAPVTVKLAS
jgi:hypothetical protein